jgi:MFS family permease
VSSIATGWTAHNLSFMYLSENPGPGVEWTARDRWTRSWFSVAPNVWYLGLTSLLTDVSSEMVTSVLPVYLLLHLRLSPLAFGTLDGLASGITAVTRWGSGVIADRWGRHKEVAASGYAMSALCRLGLLAAGRQWTWLAVTILTDRLGKGIRTAPRDALISLSAAPRGLAHAFGVHRAMDATGALIGPMVAVGLLSLAPSGFDLVFVTSFAVAVVGLGVLLLFVDNVGAPTSVAHTAPRPSLQAAIGLLGRSDYRTLVIAASGLALLTVSDAFVYLALEAGLHFDAPVFPLLAVGTASSYLVLAIPAGRLADRIGRSRLFLLGHVALLVLYGVLILADDAVVGAALAVLLLGAYYAATDGVLAALASGMLPVTLRGSGLALLSTATSVARLGASVAFGWLWTMWGREAATTSFGAALCIGLALSVVGLGRVSSSSHD